jgi:hypothetical protein
VASLNFLAVLAQLSQAIGHLRSAFLERSAMLAVRLVDFEEYPDVTLNEPETVTHWRNLGWPYSWLSG